MNDTPANEQPLDKPTSKRKWRSIASTVSLFVVAPIIALALTAFVFQSYEVQGSSMQTTLFDKDRLIIWKLPRTVAKITHHSYTPHRDDIIVFKELGLLDNPNQEKQLIKRVIGLPGDRVVVQDGHILIYNAQNPQGYDPDISHDFSNNIAHPTLGNSDVTLEPGQIFVCGDNRTYSKDSRSFGPVSVDSVVGKLMIRMLPLNSFKSFI